MSRLYFLRYFLLGLSLTLFILLGQVGVEINKVSILGAIAPRENLSKVGQLLYKQTTCETKRSAKEGCPTLDGLFVTQTVNPQASQLYQARTLTEKGQEQLDQGQAPEALKTWEEATKIYLKLHNQEGVTGSLINQSLALQALGLNLRACSTLLQALDLEDWVCRISLGREQVPKEPEKLLAEAIQEKPDLFVTVLGLRNLGDVLRLIGKPDESEIILKQALAMAKRLPTYPNINDILLSLANTERTLYSRARDRYQTTEEPVAKKNFQLQAQDKVRVALNLYQQVANSRLTSIALQAQLNQMSLILELKQRMASSAAWDVPALKALQSQTQALHKPLLEQLLTAQFSQLPALQSVYARLNFANSLMQISQSAELNQLLFQGEKNPMKVALQFAQSALRAANNLENIRAKSYALGTIGKLYTKNGQSTESKQYLEEALLLAPSVQSWDIAYQCQQELGRLYQQEGNLDKAYSAYSAAVDSLDQVRGNILSINPELQFSFKENVEPVYREYMRLLLSAPNPNLEQVIQTNSQLKLAELENYLQCGKLDKVSLDNLENDNEPPAVIHIINLDEQIEVIVRSPDGSLHRHTPNPELTRSNAENLLLNLQDRRFVYTDEQLIRSYSQALYNLLIAPVKTYFPKTGTLVFVLDSSFQSLPMALLHDGENYLLKQYSISVTLGEQLRQPQALHRGQLRALIAGLSKMSPSFNDPDAPQGLAPLPEVETEIADIKENTVSTVELLNEEFTRDRFQQKIDTSVFPVIHITTHGQFSSDPERTVILAWNQAINVRQLDRLLRSNGNQDSIELLVLSACQTAKGDKRSALGIAGVAAQAGARSTVATLWLVDAESTAKLMGEFYRGLRGGMSKAEALRQAQISILNNPSYQHPYYWAPFILVGSWL